MSIIAHAPASLSGRVVFAMGRTIDKELEPGTFVAQRLDCDRACSAVDQMDEVVDQPDGLIAIADLVRDAARMHSLRLV